MEGRASSQQTQLEPSQINPADQALSYANQIKEYNMKGL
jgi:hypothetical protein